MILNFRVRSTNRQLRPWPPFEDPVRGGGWNIFDFRSVRLEVQAFGYCLTNGLGIF